MSLPGFNACLIDRPGIPSDLWSSSSQPAGDETFELQVYDLTFRLRGIPSEVLPHLDRLRMGPSEIPSRRYLDIDAIQSPHPQFNSPELTGLTYTINFDVGEDAITFFGYYFAARFFLNAKTFQLFLAPSDPETLARDVENFLRVSTSLYLQFEQVFLFHSSAVCTGDHTFGFFGPHAAGKSTIALLAPEGTLVLGDDLNALVVKSARVHIISVPFPSEVTTLRPIVDRPVTALFRLVQSPEFGFKALSHSRKFAALIGSMPVLNKMPDCMPLLKASIETLIDTVPICELHFSKRKEIYPWIEANLHSMPR
ncbi:MAG TPA: hypothetical protein PK014_11920 [Thermoanaerobaculia bacterium]|nr:hypothetical protein [Thermoanaerobaculia bacterium]HXK69068.1 hypothetical protein [Thermoanaerobaculia bacterium]